jgi:hypothetical protein
MILFDLNEERKLLIRHLVDSALEIRGSSRGNSEWLKKLSLLGKLCTREKVQSYGFF